MKNKNSFGISGSSGTIWHIACVELLSLVFLRISLSPHCRGCAAAAAAESSGSSAGSPRPAAAPVVRHTAPPAATSSSSWLPPAAPAPPPECRPYWCLTPLAPPDDEVEVLRCLVHHHLVHLHHRVVEHHLPDAQVSALLEELCSRCEPPAHHLPPPARHHPHRLRQLLLERRDHIVRRAAVQRHHVQQLGDH